MKEYISKTFPQLFQFYEHPFELALLAPVEVSSKTRFADHLLLTVRAGLGAQHLDLLVVVVPVVFLWGYLADLRSP